MEKYNNQVHFPWKPVLNLAWVGWETAFNVQRVTVEGREPSTYSGT